MTTEKPPQPVHPVEDAPDRHTVLASAAFGALMLVAAVLVIADAAALPDTGAVVGPAAVPLPVGVLLGLLGIGLLVRSWIALRTAVPGHPWQPRAWPRVVGLVAALLLFALLLPLLGYVVSSAALFVAAALLLGAPRGWKVVAYGWTLAAVVFLVFDRLIGLTLPTGPWGF
jgi:putative tricarboxylic transport membrane protein